jgi:hypothetical protein
MDESNEKYYCEDCKNFNEAEVPADCLSGHGKVAFRRRACPDFVQENQAEMISNERSES